MSEKHGQPTNVINLLLLVTMSSSVNWIAKPAPLDVLRKHGLPAPDKIGGLVSGTVDVDVEMSWIPDKRARAFRYVVKKDKSVVLDLVAVPATSNPLEHRTARRVVSNGYFPKTTQSSSDAFNFYFQSFVPLHSKGWSVHVMRRKGSAFDSMAVLDKMAKLLRVKPD